MTALSLDAFDHVRDPRLRDLVAYWISVCNGAATPAVSAIDPSAFTPLLPDIWLCDVVHDDPNGRWRYRLTGENIRLAYGRKVVGSTLEQLTDANSLSRVAGYFTVATDRPAVVHVGGRIYSEVNEPASGERLILPFGSQDTDGVQRLLGATLHSWWARGASANDPPPRQVRTFTPVDGSPAWEEDWL